MGVLESEWVYWGVSGFTGEWVGLLLNKWIASVEGI